MDAIPQPRPIPDEPYDVTGPSALEGGWPRLRDLLWLTAVAEFKHRYAGSAFGYAWALLQPLLLFALLYVFVTEILGGFEGVENYPVLLLFNIELYQFYADSTVYATYSLERSALVRKVRLPQIVLPLASVLTTGFSIVIGLGMTLVLMLVLGIGPLVTWLLLPVILVWMLAFTVACALLFSSLYIRYRDVAQIVPIVSRVLFYFSPVLYPVEALPEGWLTEIQAFNPLAPLFVQARVWILDPDAPTWFEFADGPLMTWLPFVLFAGTCALSWFVFSRRAQRLAEEL